MPGARGVRVVAAVAVAFGFLTITEGGRVLFGPEAARLAAGRYVPFVLWFNFLAGFAYVVAGAGLWARRRWGVRLSLAIAVGTIATFAAFGVHIFLGGAFEARTVAAMSLRTAVWVAISEFASRRIAAGAGTRGAAPSATSGKAGQA
jgi:hypothetical protein